MYSSIFTSHVQKALEWVNEIDRELEWDSQTHAVAALRAVLHELRDHLPVIEAVHLSAQLPLIIRGIYFEGWQPNQVPIKERSSEQFLENIQINLGQYIRGAFEPEDLELITKTILKTLFNHIDQNEVTKLCGILPSGISSFFEEALAA